MELTAWLAGFTLIAAVLAGVAVALRRRQEPDFDRRVSEWLAAAEDVDPDDPTASDDGVVPGDDVPVGAAALSPYAATQDPTPPVGPMRWTVLVDSARDARCTDLDLLRLEVALWEQGIAASFEPCRPGEHFGVYGAQWPTRLLTDAGRLEEASEVMTDLLSLDPRENYQVRLNDPMLAVPGTREQLIVLPGMRRLARDKGGLYAVAWWLVLAAFAFEYLLLLFGFTGLL